MQRARTGLTGLAILVIVVLLASITLGSGAGRAGQGSANGETLAVLGVTPGAGDHAAPARLAPGTKTTVVTTETTRVPR